MAKVPKSGKREGQRTTEEPKPDRKPQDGKTMSELAASRGVSEATLLADYRSSLEAHGKMAEAKPLEEFRAWLIKFARAVDSNDARKDAWHELKSSCDTLVLINNLYLFTYPGKTSADALQDAYRFLRERLDKLLPRYSTLSEDTSTLFNDPKLRLLAVLSDAVPHVFAQPIRSIVMAEAALRDTRQWAKEMGSYKTEAHDLHLYAMAKSVRVATGEYHYKEIVTLIEAAYAAHEVQDEPLDEEALKKRVQRYIIRMNLPHFRPAANKRP